MRATFLAAALLAGAAQAQAWPALANRELDEVSGLAQSLADPGLLWALNDSGGKPALYRVGLQGEDYGRVDIPKAMNRDWEDLAAFTHEGLPALLIADTGDNGSTRDSVTLYAVRDPGRKGRVNLLWKLEFRYEDGPRDCESVAVDDAERAIYLLSKRERPPALYRLPLPSNTTAIAVAERLGEIKTVPPLTPDDFETEPVFTHFRNMPTAMDFLPGGRGAVVMTVREALVYRRARGESWLAALNRMPARLQLPALEQVEAAAVSADGRTLFVTSEKRPAPLLRLPLPR